MKVGDKLCLEPTIPHQRLCDRKDRPASLPGGLHQRAAPSFHRGVRFPRRQLPGDLQGGITHGQTRVEKYFGQAP